MRLVVFILALSLSANILLYKDLDLSERRTRRFEDLTIELQHKIRDMKTNK